MKKSENDEISFRNYEQETEINGNLKVILDVIYK